MGAHSFGDLRRHVGHKIVCAAYGKAPVGKVDFANIAIECETCNEVILDFDKSKRSKMEFLSHIGSTEMELWRCPECKQECAASYVPFCNHEPMTEQIRKERRGHTPLKKI